MDAIENVALKLAQVGEALGIPNLDPTSGMIFITGGKGAVGHRVATRLLRAGYPQVRLGCLHAEDLEQMNKLGAEIADFDWNHEESYAKALVGVKSVLCTAPYVKDWEKRFPAFLEACKEAGIKHFVKLSFYHARKSGDAFQDVPFIKAHGDCDEMVAAKGFDSYTILAPTHYMSNPFYFQGDLLRADQKPATLFGASGGKKVNYVSPNDVAEVAVRVILAPREHQNKEYTLTGPEAISEQHMSDLLSKHLKKPIMFVDQPLHTFEDGEKMGGDPEWLVKDLVMLEKVKSSGTEEAESFVSPDIEVVCGRKAETFEDYLGMTDYMTKMEVA